MRLVALERLSLYLAMHMKNVQNRGCTRPACELEGTVALDSELETNIENK
jgi:hypothetical protein